METCSDSLQMVRVSVLPLMKHSQCRSCRCLSMEPVVFNLLGSSAFQSTPHSAMCASRPHRANASVS